MKLTTKKLYQLIQEELLMVEILDSQPYPFKIYDGPNYPDDNSRMSVEYTFVAQKGDEEERRFRYTVKFYVTKERLVVQVDFKANETWRMTNQLDMKALATIGAIVRDFAYNLRPTLRPPFNEATKFKAWTFGEFKGDARRMRIYKWMLEKGGAQMVQVDDDEFTISWNIPL